MHGQTESKFRKDLGKGAEGARTGRAVEVAGDGKNRRKNKMNSFEIKKMMFD